MPSFLEDIAPFYGTGEKNDKGQTLDDFLKEYDPHKYESPSCTTDAVIFACPAMPPESLDVLKLLLIKRKNHPNIGWWALPGGFVEMWEDLDTAARRELQEETGIEGLSMEQIGAFGDVDRDPRSRVITTAYMALVQDGEVREHAGDDAEDAAWFQVDFTKVKTMDAGEHFTENVYELTLINEERGLRADAVVNEHIRDGLIRQQKLETVKRNQISADHGAIIVKALLILKDRMQAKR